MRDIPLVSRFHRIRRVHERCVKVRLRESLSSGGSGFARLLRSGSVEKLAKIPVAESPEVGEGKPEQYREMRKLSVVERSELVALYEAGASALELARKFECHRQTVARQLKKAGVELREQRKLTPQLLSRARALYEQGHTLAEVSVVVGVEASAVGKALKRSGLQLRPGGRRSVS
ncbi:helix-turn-helix domain-containing protein [Mycobacteroides abscessus]|uniref:helix-turn-helix domain-containing protein n=1 Tax=Mycobacteroides abscessus TaxID=36809 RepID=UPI001041E3F2|nr:helix-turn-helix domain-containing protein [Mycobacteroides abscessus]